MFRQLPSHMYGFTLAISCCVKTSNIPSKFVKYIDVPLFKAVTVFFIIKKLYGSCFVDEIQLSQGCIATMRRQFTFSTKYPRVPGTHLIELGRIKS